MAKTVYPVSTLYVDEQWSLSAFGGDTLKPYEAKEDDVFEEFPENSIPRVNNTYTSYRVPRLMILRGDDERFRVYALTGKVRRVSPTNHYYEYPLYRLEEVCNGEKEVGVGYDRLRDEYFVSLSGWHGPDGYTATLNEAWRMVAAEEVDFKVCR